MQKKAVEGASAHFDIFNALPQVIWYFKFLHLNTILKNDGITQGDDESDFAFWA